MAKKLETIGSRDGGGKAEDRRDRLAAALRENLKKRKRQTRARTQPSDDTAKS